MHNLHIAGSSVFPTCGNDMPTLTIAALALRLSDHIARNLAQTSRPAPATMPLQTEIERTLARPLGS
jgi:choline dehydrogenase-like flavoprotein